MDTFRPLCCLKKLQRGSKVDHGSTEGGLSIAEELFLWFGSEARWRPDGLRQRHGVIRNRGQTRRTSSTCTVELLRHMHRRVGGMLNIHNESHENRGRSFFRSMFRPFSPSLTLSALSLTQNSLLYGRRAARSHLSHYTSLLSLSLWGFR